MPRRWASWAASGIAASGIAVLFTGCAPKPSPLDVPVVLRGHTEIALEADGTLIPRLFSAGRPGLCLEVDTTLDTSLWEMELSFNGLPSPSGLEAPAARSATTLCFDGDLPPELPEGSVTVCGKVIDGFNGKALRVPCLPALYTKIPAAYEQTKSALQEVLKKAYDLSSSELVGELDPIRDQAQQDGLPLLSIQVTLITAHFLTLEGTAEALAEVDRRFNTLPPWLDAPEASNHGAMAAYQHALLQLDTGRRLEDAWIELGRADRRFRRIADPKRFTVTMVEASILHQVGAGSEATRRLRSALAESEKLGATARLLKAGRGNLAWFILLNPHASLAELDEAEAYLGTLEDSNTDPIELANRQVDLAYLEVRRGRSPQHFLTVARQLLDDVALAADHVRHLRDWADLVEGSAALARGDTVRALELCRPQAERRDTRLAAWAHSCSARAHRQSGDPAAAARAFQQALLQHAYAAPQRIGQNLAVGPGQRADDFARAARLEIERGSPAAAWQLLLDLDRLSAAESERRRCRQQAQDGYRQRWEEIDTETAALLKTLLELDGPASTDRHAQQEQQIHELKSRLQKLWREWPGCAGRHQADDTGLDYRAFALDDEILLLHRPNGRVKLARRTPFSRQELRDRSDRIADGFAHRNLTNAQWEELLAPLAEALRPVDTDPGDTNSVDTDSTVTYALHGLLQGVPLAMLPLATSAQADGARWLGETTLVALQSAGAGAEAVQQGDGDEAVWRDSEPRLPLFVVDPRSNLPAAPRSLTTYRKLFPDARVLHGLAATHGAFRQQVGRSAWLHIDAHGLYDPAFPELSAIELADRPFRWVELADDSPRLRFANMSGCQTGRWPITADSGVYGMAGLLTRLGVHWAVASRTNLPDRVAEDFNHAFYTEVAKGRSVPQAYRQALRTVIAQHPIGDWGGLLLLRGAPDFPKEIVSAGGQNASLANPLLIER
jgi:hypothetical protein